MKLFKDILNITEAFDTKFDGINWESYSGNFLAKAHLGDEEFRLYIEPATYTFQGQERVWLNVAFARVVNGVVSQELINTGSNQSKQIGAIVNALVQKLKKMGGELKIDAIVFIVEKGQEKRIPLYKRLMLSKVYGIRPWQYRFSIDWFGGTALIASKELLTTDEYAALKNDVISRGKSII